MSAQQVEHDEPWREGIARMIRLQINLDLPPWERPNYDNAPKASIRERITK